MCMRDFFFEKNNTPVNGIKKYYIFDYFSNDYLFLKLCKTPLLSTDLKTVSLIYNIT